MSTPQNPLIGLYRLCLTSQKLGLLGAPVFHLSLLVNPSASAVSGMVHIAQSITPQSPPANITVSGTIHEMAFGAQVTKVIAITGEYLVSFPPPAIGSYIARFSGVLVFQGNDFNNGISNYQWSNQNDLGVPTKSSPCQ